MSADALKVSSAQELREKCGLSNLPTATQSTKWWSQHTQGKLTGMGQALKGFREVAPSKRGDNHKGQRPAKSTACADGSQGNGSATCAGSSGRPTFCLLGHSKKSRNEARSRRHPMRRKPIWNMPSVEVETIRDTLEDDAHAKSGFQGS